MATAYDAHANSLIGEVFLRLLAFAHAQVEFAEAEVAAGDEREGEVETPLRHDRADAAIESTSAVPFIGRGVGYRRAARLGCGPDLCLHRQGFSGDRARAAVESLRAGNDPVVAAYATPGKPCARR